MADTAVPRFDSVCIDCPDPAELARFYGALLVWPIPEGGGESEYVSLEPPGGVVRRHPAPTQHRRLVPGP